MKKFMKHGSLPPRGPVHDEAAKIEAALVCSPSDPLGSLADRNVDAVGADQREITFLVEAHTDVGSMFPVGFGPAPYYALAEVEFDIAGRGDRARHIGDFPAQRIAAIEKRNFERLPGFPFLHVIDQKFQAKATALSQRVHESVANFHGRNHMLGQRFKQVIFLAFFVTHKKSPLTPARKARSIRDRAGTRRSGSPSG